MARTHITDSEPYDIKINDVIALRVDLKRQKKSIFDNIISQLFSMEGIIDEDAKKTKKWRYKKHYEGNKTTIGILLNMLVNAKIEKTERQTITSAKIHYNKGYHRWNEDYAEVEKQKRELIKEISLLKKQIKKMGK